MSAALRSVVARLLQVHVTHVYNDQIDSVFADPEIRIFEKKKQERLKRPLRDFPEFRDIVHIFILIGLISANKSISLFPSLIFLWFFAKTSAKTWQMG